MKKRYLSLSDYITVPYYNLRRFNRTAHLISMLYAMDEGREISPREIKRTIRRIKTAGDGTWNHKHKRYLLEYEQEDGF